MRFGIYTVLSALLILGGPRALFGQACSCASPPLVNTLEQPSVPSQDWRFGFRYEFIDLSEIVSGKIRLEDDTRRRTAHSLLFETSYGLFRSLSFTAIFSLIQQERKISLSSGADDFLLTRGIGDGMLIVKYNVWPLASLPQMQVALGGGFKMPLGKSSLTANGALISSDMQPGSGSWDGVLWSYLGFSSITPSNTFATVSYSFKGRNKQAYKFGDEFLSSVGASFELDKSLDYVLLMRYRHVSADRRFSDSDVPNSGGRWINFAGGLNVNLSRSINVGLLGEIPVYRKLNGTQLTTNFSASLSIFYTLARR